MTPVYQTTFGKQGNCFAACLASLFDDPIEKWEATANWRDDWREQTNKLLYERHGLEHIEVNCSHINELEKLPSIGVCLNHNNIYMLGVISKNNLPHVVLGKYDKNISDETKHLTFYIVHDPLGPHEENPIDIQCVILFSKCFK